MHKMSTMNYRDKSLTSLIGRSIRYAGLWFAITGSNIHRMAKFAIFCFLSTYALQLIALVMAKGDSERLFECFSVISFCGMGVLKLSSLYNSRKRWCYLLTEMSTLENEQLTHADTLPEDYQSDNEEQILSATNIKTYTYKFNSTSTILSRIYSFTAVIFILSPFIEYAIRILCGNTSTGYPHILPGWAPLDDLHFFGYLVTILFEAVAAVYCVFIHIAFDLTCVGVMIFVCGQFSSLISNSERIGGDGIICNLLRERDMTAHFRILKCHRTHVKLDNLITELDKLIKNILGFYFFLATLTLCSVAVRLKSEEMSVMQIVSLLQYMCATLTQLFLFCSYGDAVMNESSVGTGEGPFCAALWCLSPKIRRELSLLGLGMMQPRRLHAGPFNTLDLPSFIQIVRAAYSYYAVLGNKSE